MYENSKDIGIIYNADRHILKDLYAVLTFRGSSHCMLPSGVFLTQTYVHLLYSKLKRLCDNFGGV